MMNSYVFAYHGAEVRAIHRSMADTVSLPEALASVGFSCIGLPWSTDSTKPWGLLGYEPPKGQFNMTARSTWKAFERRVATDMHTKRLPVSGRQEDLGGSDVEPTKLFGVSCKLGYTMPGYLSQWLAAICGWCAPRGLVGIVVWKKKGGRDKDAVVLMRYEDFVDLNGKLDE